MSALGSKYQIKDNKLIITFPIVPAKAKTGKSMLIATTRGAEQFVHDGKTVNVNLNAYIMMDEWNKKS